MKRLKITIALAAAAAVTGFGVSYASTGLNTSATPGPPRVAAGAVPDFHAGGRSDAGAYGWMLDSQALTVTRDGGRYWSRASLPPSAEQITGVAVLPTEAIIVAAGNEDRTVDIESLADEAGAWTSQEIPVDIEVGPSEAVEATGAVAGVIVNEPAWGGERRGVWLRASSDGQTWNAYPAPTTGAVTDEAGALWLVGGPTNSLIYQSSDDGASWQQAQPPVGLASTGPVAFSVLERAAADQLVTTATVPPAETEVITASDTSGEWQWSAGPILKLGGEYGTGTPAHTSTAEDVLWDLGPTNQIARVDLATGEVWETTATGLPENGEITLHATGAEAAWASYATSTCTGAKASCTETNGFMDTTDGGASWHEIHGAP